MVMIHLLRFEAKVLYFLKEKVAKKVLIDVYYIPSLKASIIILGQATDSGCEVSMKSDYLFLLDSETHSYSK